MHPLLTMGGLVGSVAWRRAPQAISMQARLNISGLCITHSWAQDITQVQDTIGCVHVFKQETACVCECPGCVHASGRVVVEDVNLNHALFTAASLNQQNQGAPWVGPNWKTGRLKLIKFAHMKS